MHARKTSSSLTGPFDRRQSPPFGFGRRAATYGDNVPQLDPSPLFQIPCLAPLSLITSRLWPHPERTKAIQHSITALCIAKPQAAFTVQLEGETLVEVGRVEGPDEEDWCEDVWEDGMGGTWEGRCEAEEFCRGGELQGISRFQPYEGTCSLKTSNQRPAPCKPSIRLRGTLPPSPSSPLVSGT